MTQKLIVSIAALCLTISLGAQELISKIPSNATAVVTIKGRNVTDLMSVSEFSKSKLGQMMIKEISHSTKDEITAIEGLGLNLAKDFHYFLEIDKSTYYNVFLVPLKNPDDFMKLMPERKREQIIREGGLSYLQGDPDGMTMIWNKDNLVVVLAEDESIESYFYDDYSYNYDEPEFVAADAADAAGEVVEVVKTTIMSFEKLEHDFGTIEKNIPQETVFKFTNMGDVPLIISDATSSCGCTVPTYPKNTPIAPGETGELIVKYNASGQNQISKTITVNANTASGAEIIRIKAFVNPEGEAIDTIEEAVEVEEYEIEETVIESTGDPYYDDQYSQRETASEKRRAVWEAEQEVKRKELAVSTLKKAKQIINGNNVANSILKNARYMKHIGPKGNEEASVWVNDFMKIYENAMFDYMGMMGGMDNPYNYMNLEDFYSEASIAGKLNFEDDQATFNVSYNMSDEMAEIYKPMYNGKFNKNLLNYLNEDSLLGYWNINTSTAGVLEAYPNLLDKMFKADSKETMATGISLGADLFALLIDEEAAATLVRGDMLLALTDFREREVTYTDYEYDENYDYKEIEKTKTENIPDFLFMFTSEQEQIFKKLMRIGVNEEELAFEDGMFRALNLGSSNPFEFYIMYKDNTVFLGSSKQHLTAIKNGTYVSKVSNELKSSLRKNSTSMFMNGKKVISEIPEGEFPRALRDEIGFLTQNVEDVHVSFSKIKGNSLKGELIWETSTKGHTNSFSYFVNMIDALMD